MENTKGEVKDLYSQFTLSICNWCTDLHNSRACAWRALSNEYCPELGKLDDVLFQFEKERKKSAESYRQEVQI